MEKIVTKDWLKRRLETRPCPYCDRDHVCGICDNGSLALLPSQRIAVLGRVLVAIYNNQTDDERFAFAAKEFNGRGFTAYDAKLGTQAAIMFIAIGTLPEWLARVWLVEKAGYPRICKYVRQLNEIANAKKGVAV